MLKFEKKSVAKRLKEFMISILSGFVGMSSQLILRDAKLKVLVALIIVLETAGKLSHVIEQIIVLCMKQRHKYLCCVPERDKVQITVFVSNKKSSRFTC